MKKIDAIVKTSRFDDIVARLRLIGVAGLTLVEVFRTGPAATTESMSRGHGMRMQTVPRYQLTVVVRDEDVAHVVNAIVHAARTEAPEASSDGFITVEDVLGILRIRTGEEAEAAL
jgi:nitrogen regulatory protein P-II 1